MLKDELIVIRHARSEANVRKNHVMDCDLTDYGIRQARNIGRFLAKHMNVESFSFYTSPFYRCLQTAKYIWAGMGESGCWRAFDVLPDLREYINHCGREAAVPARRDFHDAIHWPKEPDSWWFRDEFNEEFANRIRSAHSVLASRSVVVTHGLPALLLLQIASNPSLNSVPIWDHSLDNGSISYVVNGRVVWHGRNLYHELDYDPFDTKRSYDGADLLK